MIYFSNNKIHNAYLIETYNYESVKKSIIDFAILHGFDKNLIDAGTHPDIVFIESKDKIIPIDTIRKEVLDTTYLTPKIADRKFYIIYDAKNIMEASENAMLKTLEEPPQFVSFFLVTDNVNALLPTTKSRCQIIKDTSDVDYKDILSLPYVDDAIRSLANIKYDLAGEKMSFIEEALSENNNLKKLIKIYRLAIRDALIYKITLSKNKMILREKEDLIIAIAETLSMEELGRLVDKLNTLSLASNYNVNKEIATLSFLT